MAPPSWIDSGFILANWEVRPRHGTLLVRDQSASEPVRIEPRVMAVLTCLARHVGEVVSRDEFSAEVWGGRVVSDEALSRCISLLRHVLADDSREPRFIRTIARIGYTLVPVPTPLPPCSADPGGIPLPSIPATFPEATDAGAIKPPRSGLHLRWPALVVIVSVGVGVATAISFAYFFRARQPEVEVPPPVTRLLVLPFDTRGATGLSRDMGIELADEIADSLAHVERLQISGRTSADTLAAAHTDAVEAGQKLGVDAVVNGEVAGQPGGLRATIRLTAVKDARVLWSRVYERQSADIFAAQSSIASAVARELMGLLKREEFSRAPSEEPESRDLEVYQLYLRGAHQVRLRGEDSLRRAVELFSAAARRDPKYARAQVGLASAYALLPSYSYEDPTEMFALAEKALDNADRISHNRYESAGTRGYVGFMRGHWIEAETSFRTAIVADPNNPEVRQWYSQLLGAVGRVEAALTQARLAQEIDPLAPVVADRLGILHLGLGRDAEAANDAALASELGLDEVAYPETKILLKLHQRRDADAAEDLRSLMRSLNRSDGWVAPTIEAYRHPEKRPAAIELLDRTWAAGGISARIYFGLMVLLDSPARAFRGFASLPDNDVNLLELLFSADAVAVRREPAFGEFVRKRGIEAYWDRFGWPNSCRRDGSQITCH